MVTKVSIIVPVYNVRHYLTECVDSILAQTYEDYECILVDDGSTDGSGSECDYLSRRDSRIRVIHRPNGGLSVARNTGLDVATGKYVAFVDSDDIIYPKALEVLVNRMERDDIDVVIGNVMLNDLKSGERHLFGPLKIFCDSGDVYQYGQNGKLLDAMFNVAAWNKLYKLDVFRNRRFICGIKFEDVPMWTDILFSGVRIGFVDEIVYLYNVNRKGSIVTARDYRGYPGVWEYQLTALISHGLFKDELACAFVGRVILKFIQAFNLSSGAVQKEFYDNAQSFFRKCGDISFDCSHQWLIAFVEYIHLVACRYLSYDAYKAMFFLDGVIANENINLWLKRKFQ